jgi:hypothetical protein
MGLGYLGGMISRKIFRLAVLAAPELWLTPNALAQAPAFPGALGYGAFVTGGRGGTWFTSRTRMTAARDRSVLPWLHRLSTGGIQLQPRHQHARHG